MKLKQIVIIFLLLICPGMTSTLSAADRTLQDPLGRKVKLPSSPQRVVALAPSITEIIFALKEQQRLIGVTLYSDYPAPARRLPKVGSYVQLDLEKIVSLKPDLCLAIKDGNPKQIIDRLEALKIPVFAVHPMNLESVMESILFIGNILEAADRADVLVKDLRQRIQQVKARIELSDNRPRVFFQIGFAPITAVGTDTFIHELILLAGGRNVTTGPTSYPRLSKEEVIALAPDVMIVTSMARGASFEEIIGEWSRWPQIPAVHNGRVHVTNSDLFDRPSPRLVDALEELAKLIHPELFKSGNAP